MPEPAGTGTTDAAGTAAVTPPRTRVGGPTHVGTATTDPVARATYRLLRILLVALPVLLLVASFLVWVTGGRIERSISDYYDGDLRDVFVAMLAGIAVCLVAYRGFPAVEDYTLNWAGFLALIVAFVPNSLTAELERLDGAARTQAALPARIVLTSLLVVSAAVVLVEWRTTRATVHAARTARDGGWVFWLMTVLGAAVVGLLVVRLVQPGTTFAWLHGAAAIVLIVGLALAVLSHGWPATDAVADRRYRTIYLTVAALMVAGLVLWPALERAEVDEAVLVVEWWEIVLFVVFWVTETIRTWDPVAIEPLHLPDEPGTPVPPPLAPPQRPAQPRQHGARRHVAP
ncbi:hypothetical protein [Cellulomonas fimi]|uniref:hypothetical protein n=1 Tax=Cellulomonas fimi TaxID=1708 RepID=UPI00234C2683|nr:hypothetical protein [Cellulomonas fimi]